MAFERAARDEINDLRKQNEELKSSLSEMIDIYWNGGDGIDPAPACIQRARAAVTNGNSRA
jgi:hypothetical protein